MSFSFNKLETGAYSIDLQKEGYKLESYSVVVFEGKTTESHLLIERVPAVVTADRAVLDFGENEEQWGYERPLFAEETLFYPYSDCEDRSILFATLVRELLDLDVVFLHFSGHLATAVAFDEHISGDYIDVDGRHYLVCDPTYINAPIGMAMPDLDLESVIRL